MADCDCYVFRGAINRSTGVGSESTMIVFVRVAGKCASGNQGKERPVLFPPWCERRVPKRKETIRKKGSSSPPGETVRVLFKNEKDGEAGSRSGRQTSLQVVPTLFERKEREGGVSLLSGVREWRRMRGTIPCYSQYKSDFGGCKREGLGAWLAARQRYRVSFLDLSGVCGVERRMARNGKIWGICPG